MRSSPPKPEADHDACGVGFIAQLGSQGNRDVVERALIALARLSHRGGVDADGLSGDGAGLLIPIPKDFIRERARDLNIELPKNFGVGMVFIPSRPRTPCLLRNRIRRRKIRSALSRLACRTDFS